MGLYTIPCPVCGMAHTWFSGNLDQRCGDCRELFPLTEAERAALNRALEKSVDVIDEGSAPNVNDGARAAKGET